MRCIMLMVVQGTTIKLVFEALKGWPLISASFAKKI